MKKYMWNIINLIPFYGMLFYVLLSLPSSCDFENIEYDTTVYDTVQVYDTIIHNDTSIVEKDSIVLDTITYVDTNRIEIIDTVQLFDTNYYDSTTYTDSIRFIDSVVYDTIMNYHDSIVYRDSVIFDTNYVDSVTYDTLIYDSIIVDTNCMDSMTYLLEDLYPNKKYHVGFDNAQFDSENDTLTFTYEVRNKAWYTDSLYTKIYVNNHEKATDTIAHFNFTDWHRKTWQYPDSTTKIDIYLYYKQTKIDSISNKIIGE